MVEIIWKIGALSLVIFSFLPLADSKHWFFRVFDFIRIQITVLLLLLAVASPFIIEFKSLQDLLIGLPLTLAIVYQLSSIVPYFPRLPKTSKKLENEMVAISVNVKQDNKHYHRLVDLVKAKTPDILVTLETNKIWEEKLNELENTYSAVIRVPKDNRYGMHLYTTLEIKKYKIHYLISEEHPSIEAILVKNSCEFKFWCIHPPPPSPTEKPTSKQKDAALFKVARMIRKSDIPTIIAGDFNNVTWSKTSKLFSRISKLEDARRHRGFFPTFPANFPLLGFPIDLIFHSTSTDIGRIKTMKSIGSDHLPLLFSFAIKGGKTPSKPIDKDLDKRVTKTIKQGKAAAKKEN